MHLGQEQQAGENKCRRCRHLQQMHLDLVSALGPVPYVLLTSLTIRVRLDRLRGCRINFPMCIETNLCGVRTATLSPKLASLTLGYCYVWVMSSYGRVVPRRSMLLGVYRRGL